MKFNLTYKAFGKTSILVEWPVIIKQEIIEDIVSFERQVRAIDSILDTIITYNSLLIRFSKAIEDHKDIIIKLKKIYNTPIPFTKKK